MTWFNRAWTTLALIVLLALPAQPVPATEAFSGARDLLGWCENMDRDDIHWGLCVGSITAAHDVIMTYQALADMEQLVCTSEQTSRGDVVTQVMKYMYEHPEEMDYSLGDVVFSAMIDKFPCP